MLGCRTTADSSESFTEQTPVSTPALYTYNAYSGASCAGTPLATFINILVNGTCAPSSTPPNLLSITVVAVPSASTTTTTINIGAVVGAVLTLLFATVSAVLFCRYKKLYCFAQRSLTPSAPPVMNPVGIFVK